MILMALPDTDFDPTEASVAWKILKDAGYIIKFATPEGKKATADERMITGKGLFCWSPFLRADSNARKCYQELVTDPEFCNPLAYEALEASSWEGFVFPGGHAPGMKVYLESKALQDLIVDAFEANKPVGAICHGVLLVARSVSKKTEKSVLYGRKTTTLQKDMELTAWLMTFLWLKRYYRTYPETTQAEVISFLKEPTDFKRGPLPLLRDTPQNWQRGFVVKDENYLSARWPGDAHRFGNEFVALLKSSSNTVGKESI